MDLGHRGNADRELHNPRVSSGGLATQEGERAVPSGGGRCTIGTQADITRMLSRALF